MANAKPLCFEFRALLAVLLMGCSSSPGAEPIEADEPAPPGAIGTSGNGGSDSGAGGSSGSSGGGAGESGQAAAGASGSGVAGGSGGAGGAKPSPGMWVNATANLGNLSSVCGNTYRIWAAPKQDKVLVAVVRVGIYATTDGGTTWALEGGSTSPNHDHNGVCFDPEHPEVFWAAGMHANPGVFKTTDGGASFKPIGNITNIDDVSVDFTDPDRNTILAGAHEQHLLYKSTNGGASFTDISAAFPAGKAFTFAPLVVDANVYTMGTAFYSADPSEGVFRTSNGGTSWTQVSTVSVGGSGLKTSWGSLFYMAKSGGSILKGSADGSTFATLPAPGAKGYSIAIELPGKHIATTAWNGKVNSIIMSGDEGKTWATIADNIPAPPWWSPGIGPYVAYNSVRGAFFVSYYDCGKTVHPDAIWRYDIMIE